MEHHYEIPGVPRPQGRPRTRIVHLKHGKSFATIYEDGKDKTAKHAIKQHMQQYTPLQALSGPLKAELVYYLPRPLGEYGTGRNAGQLKDSAAEFHTKRPDLDNCAKLTLDALNEILWIDDSQICELIVKKQYSNKPRTEITVSEIKSEGLFKE